MLLMARELLAHESLILACAFFAGCPEGVRKADEALNAEEMDWPALVRTAIQHGLAPLLWHVISQFAADSRIPPEVAACLERIAGANACRNAVMLRETARLSRALQDAGIRCMALKGVGLAITVYPDPALRNFADIDLLVDPENYAAAGRIAQALGLSAYAREDSAQDYHALYYRIVEEDILTGTLAPEYDPLHSSPYVEEARRRVMIEIHRRVFTLAGGIGRRTDMNLFWQNALRARLPDGSEICTPAPEAMLTHLAAHAGRHTFRRLLFPADVVIALQAYGPAFDWDRLTCLAEECGAKRDLFLILQLVQSQCGSLVPEGVLARLSPASAAVGSPGRLSLAGIFTSMRLVAQESSAETWLRLFHGQNPGEFLRSVRTILFPSPAMMRRIYGVEPALLLAACYFVRPLQLAGRLVRVTYRIARVRFLQREPG